VKVSAINRRRKALGKKKKKKKKKKFRIGRSIPQ
jgi:hypothetical protein